MDDGGKTPTTRLHRCAHRQVGEGGCARAGGKGRVTAARARTPARVVRQLEEIEEDGGSGALDLPTGSLEVSSLDKVFFPSTKHTKGDIMRFYAAVSRVLLPAIADRPLVMKRFPNGVRGEAFYQQRAPAHTPDSVRVEKVSDKGYAAQDKLIGGDL